MSKYNLSISMNVLENLGENLYSSTPAVIAETIANSYDANATKVEINIDTETGIITIKDDGDGMDEEECNKKYLNVGYHRREDKKIKTKKGGRLVMGRKGIGKLSLFAIAKNIEIHSVMLDEEGKIKEKNGFIMNKDKIKKHIKSEPKNLDKNLSLDAVEKDKITIDKGTKIILTDLKKGLTKTETFLRKRLARKFSVLGKKNHFQVYVNGEEISIKDRDYFSKIQYLWYFGNYGEESLKQCKNLDNKEKINNEVILNDGKKYFIEGWIGTVHERSNLEEGNNTIVLHSRGKSVHDNLLGNIDNSGFVTKYLIGEITASFLDDDREDITTSDRQNIQENNERFEKMRDFVREVINNIRKQWQEWREDNSIKKACEISAIKTWFDSLGPDNKRYAKQLFGKIDRFPISNEEYKRVLYKNAILAFQTLAVSNNLSKLENISPEQFEPFLELLAEIDQLEAVHYHDIVKGRLKVLEEFEGLVDKNVKEKVLQKYLFNHLWLLDPSWERTDSESSRMEKTVIKDIKNVKLTKEESLARLDIYYRTAAGKHIIIELKKSDAYVNLFDLQKQLDKYRTALTKCLNQKFQIEVPNIEIISILGSRPNPKEKSERFIKQLLDPLDARYLTYDKLIEKACMSYKEFLEKNKAISKIQELVESI